jgi:hypothetical protein
MPRTFAAFVPPLLAALALAAPGEAFAGPPGRPSGKMVLAVDEVQQAMRKARREPDPCKRLLIYCHVTQRRDPRIIIGACEIMMSLPLSTEVWEDARAVLRAYFIGTDEEPAVWWEKNQADLRRRAAQLPR